MDALTIRKVDIDLSQIFLKTPHSERQREAYIEAATQYVHQHAFVWQGWVLGDLHGEAFNEACSRRGEWPDELIETFSPPSFHRIHGHEDTVLILLSLMRDDPALRDNLRLTPWLRFRLIEQELASKTQSEETHVRRVLSAFKKKLMLTNANEIRFD